jgi:hypothetical protein
MRSNYEYHNAAYDFKRAVFPKTCKKILLSVPQGSKYDDFEINTRSSKSDQTAVNSHNFHLNRGHIKWKSLCRWNDHTQNRKFIMAVLRLGSWFIPRSVSSRIALGA